MLAALASACKDAGRDPSEVRLLAVTKTVAPEVAARLVELGSRDLGENRVTGLEAKRAWFDEHGIEARWHFIGHIQRNKARRVLELSDVVHSLDSLRLIETCVRLADEHDLHPEVYVQVKLTDEDAKHGLAPEEVEPAVELLRASGALPLAGLMTMAPWIEDPGASSAAATRTFEDLARIAKDLPGAAFLGGAPLLSMGMSGDHVEAIRAGAHWVRIGSALMEGVDASAYGGPPSSSGRQGPPGGTGDATRETKETV